MIKLKTGRVIKYYLLYPIYMLFTKKDIKYRKKKSWVCLYPKLNMFIAKLSSTETQLWWIKNNKI